MKTNLREACQRILDMYLISEEKHFLEQQSSMVKRFWKIWKVNHIVHDLRRLKHALDTNEIK